MPFTPKEIKVLSPFTSSPYVPSRSLLILRWALVPILLLSLLWLKARPSELVGLSLTDSASDQGAKADPSCGNAADRSECEVHPDLAGGVSRNPTPPSTDLAGMF
jgi:hypothetical protein